MNCEQTLNVVLGAVFIILFIYPIVEFLREARKLDALQRRGKAK